MVEAVDERSDCQSQGVALNLALGVDREEILAALQDLLDQLTRHPRILTEVWRYFMTEAASITLGFSTLDPSADKRFSDPAWHENPFYKRLGQYHLAMGNALDKWLDGSELEEMNEKRARFLLGILKDLLAPVNNLYSNPTALKSLFESQGESLVNGLRNYLDDVRHNYGYPAVADRNSFVIGKDVAASEGSVIFRNELLELIQYEPTTEKVHERPFLYVFSQVNRFYLGDLTPDRSLFQEMLAEGIQVFAVSWRNPTTEQRDWSLQTYAEGVIQAIEVLQEISGHEKINLMGLCAGGITTATAAGLLNARGNDYINCHSLFVNILDNHTEDSDFGLFVSERSIEMQKAKVQAAGIFSEKDVFEMFAWLTPEESVMAFYRDNYLLGKNPPIHPLLFWSMDYTRVSAGLQCDYLDLAWGNKLAKREMMIAGHRIDLSKIIHDVYIMAGSTDHITPWRGCYRTTSLFGGNVKFILTNQNHTQTISNRPNNKHMKYWIADELPEDVEDWVTLAKEVPSSWRLHWIDWLKTRSGNEVDAMKEPGSENHPALSVAPGRYVLES
ncbi:MAG: alpha/beta fold hydrolase [bacterium]|nr:alpha/beta fold hydrolase [Gammaproteobacteria bacterium]HIL98697.1 alpha/beta fold hydrolase [Pseudomonadales bacterium]